MLFCIITLGKVKKKHFRSMLKVLMFSLIAIQMVSYKAIFRNKIWCKAVINNLNNFHIKNYKVQ